MGRRRSRSKSSMLSVGAVSGAAVRAALGAGRETYRPFTIEECIRVADILSEESPIPKMMLRVGIALDTLSSDGREIARHIKVSRDLVETYETLWELLDQRVRFNVIRDAVSLIVALRLEQK